MDFCDDCGMDWTPAIIGVAVALLLFACGRWCYRRSREQSGSSSLAFALGCVALYVISALVAYAAWRSV